MITNKDISIDSEKGKITLNGNKYDLGTQGEIDTAVKDVYSVMGQNGAKNLIPYPYYRSSGYVHRGVTYTVDNNGKITANGTATGGNSYFEMINAAYETFKLKPNTRYIISGCPSGGGDSTYLLSVSYNVGGGSSTTLALDFGNGAEFTTPQNADANYTISVRIVSGTAITNLVFEPMLRLASDTDNTYEPYAMTNKQLTDRLATKQDTLTFDSAPTVASTNPVESGGIKTAIEAQVSFYTAADQSVSVTGPYTDIQLTKPVEAGYSFYLLAAFAYNTRGWNLSNINSVDGAIRVYSPENSEVTSNLKTHWLKIKNS